MQFILSVFEEPWDSSAVWDLIICKTILLSVLGTSVNCTRFTSAFYSICIYILNWCLLIKIAYCFLFFLVSSYFWYNRLHCPVLQSLSDDCCLINGRPTLLLEEHHNMCSKKKKEAKHELLKYMMHENTFVWIQ